MPNLDAATRARLADALEGATPEMLREDAAEAEAWARDFAEATSLSTENRFAPRLLRLAAIGLAVAEICDGPMAATVDSVAGAYIDPGHRSSVKASTLPSALAALLRASEGA